MHSLAMVCFQLTLVVPANVIRHSCCLRNAMQCNARTRCRFFILHLESASHVASVVIRQHQLSTSTRHINHATRLSMTALSNADCGLDSSFTIFCPSLLNLVAVTNGDVEQPPWGGGLKCNDTAVVSDVAVESQGWGAYAHGILSVHVRCTDRTEESDFVIDHFALTFTASGIIGLQGFRRVVPSSPPPYTVLDALSATPLHPLGSVAGANLAQPGGSRVRPVEYFEGCAATELAQQAANGTGASSAAQTGVLTFYAADLQCQGLRHDRCGCIDGTLRCVLAAGDLGFEADGLVTEADMLAMKNGSAAPWCEDGDIADDWFLLKVRASLHLLM